MESHADFLSYLAVLSGRALGLAFLTWLALRVCRVKSASARHAVWTVITAMMILQAVASPALPSLPVRILAPALDGGPEIATLTFGQVPVPVSNSHRAEHRFLFRALLSSWRQIVIGMYATVTFALLVQLIFGYFFARRLVRRSNTIEELSANPAARIRESVSISVPMTVGQIAPTILLPMGWREWDPAKLSAVLSHEEAHVRRADWAIGVMARINCCFFWFNPLSWWLNRELALLAEYACDDSVLAQIGDRREYARALLEIAYAMKSAHGRLLGDAMPMAKETNVEKRLEQILDDTRTIPPAFGRRGWVTVLVCSLPVAYLASTVELAPSQTRTVAPVAEPSRAPSPSPEAKEKPVLLIAQAKSTPPARANTVPTPAASPYQKWLDEEAVYIISDDERRAFNRFTNDEERQHFIEQFWLRRDPTPGTEENEMKDEHYRRIAFANDHLSATVPGWKTDRGMIYIKYGPPDAQDSYGVTPSTYPYEKWRYRYIEGFGPNAEFEFVDPTMTGRYHLTQDPSEKEARR
jgi:GWxTD domain-containing protein